MKSGYLLQRKDKLRKRRYSPSCMDALQFSPKQSVIDSLKHGEAVSKVFIRSKTACVGCLLARFCTLSDVARTYELELEPFLRELQQAIQTENPTLIGEQNETLDQDFFG